MYFLSRENNGVKIYWTGRYWSFMESKKKEYTSHSAAERAVTIIRKKHPELTEPMIDTDYST